MSHIVSVVKDRLGIGGGWDHSEQGGVGGVNLSSDATMIKENLLLSIEHQISNLIVGVDEHKVMLGIIYLFVPWKMLELIGIEILRILGPV